MELVEHKNAAKFSLKIQKYLLMATTISLVAMYMPAIVGKCFPIALKCIHQLFLMRSKKLITISNGSKLWQAIEVRVLRRQKDSIGRL